jgi:metal-sulfur cluster biosynthetic enzyme
MSATVSSSSNESIVSDVNSISGEKTAMEGVSMGITEDKVREALKQVIDPELYINIVDLGLVYVIDVKGPGEDGRQDVHIEMTMTSPMCPAGPQLVGGTKAAASAIPGVGHVEVKVVMDPPWSQEMMTEDARDQLGIF